MTSAAESTISNMIPVYNEKSDIQRLVKPLPTKPLPSLSPNNLVAIDDSSRIHISKLLLIWLSDLQIPIKPWSDVLFAIALSLCEKATNSTQAEKNRTVWLQTFTNNLPMDSKFLLNVAHGKQVPTDELSIEFPIGGTIRIYGLDDDSIASKFVDLIQALVYLTHSLYLESYVMRDSHVKLIVTSPLFNDSQRRPDSVAEKAKPDSDNDRNRSHHTITKRTNGLFNWFKKLAPHHHVTDKIPSTPPPSVISEKAVKRRSNPISAVGEGIKRGLSLNNIAKRYQAPPPMPSQHDFEIIKENDPHRFFKFKQKIEHAYISTSPQCHFPFPVLLNRLEIEEDELRSEQRKIMMSNIETECQTPNSTRPIQRRRRSSVVSSFASLKRNSILSTDIQLPQSLTAYSSIRTPGLLADSKIGLEHLNLDTSSLKSFKYHQSITLSFTVHPIGCPDRPCLGPIMSKIDYFRYHTPQSATANIFPNIDQTLGHTIRHWCTISQLSCQIHIDEQTQFIPGSLVETPLPAQSRPDLLANGISKSSQSSLQTISSLMTPYTAKSIRQCSKFHGCNQLLLNHVYSFAHGIGKLNVYTNTDLTCIAADKDRITSWISCNICDQSTPHLVLDERTDKFSFAKYLELIFYSSKLAAPEPFCEHTTEKIDRNNITRNFLYNGITVKFIYEDAKFYELRVPRIQMANDEPAALSFSEFTTPRLGLDVLKEWKNKSASQDVDSFFESVRTHLDMLNHYTKAEGRRKIRQFQNADHAAAKQTQAELKSLDAEIRALSKRLDTDHQNLLYILADTSMNELNDFRRHFAIQSESIIQYLSEWQHTKCEEVTDEIGWDSPDYISSKTVHSFPGSSVLVREDEPSSIIAYTLSSNDYIQEILLDVGTEYSEKNSINNNGNKNPSMPSLSSTGSTSNTEATVNEPVLTVPPSTDKRLSTPPPSSNILDNYYSSIERKYISPSTGAGTETASFRSMMIEVVKSSVVEAQVSNVKRLEDIKAKLSPWAKRQEELETEGDLKRQQLTERTLKPLLAIQQQQQQETKEVKLASYFYEGDANKDTTVKKKVSPHIKHKFVHEGVEFTCVVYYAKEFEMLRKQCDINQLFIQSLSRCQSWTASGGKSKSHFYKTQDDRLVIKEMMNAWNVVEKDAFLKFAPKYFEHMKRSANEPSVLAKIFGFFTIRMNNTLDKKAPVINLDVLVMEHLFYNQNIIRRFDFKGIQDRHVDEFRKQQKDTTLWDGDWINEYRTQLPVHEQSKAILELAIANDTEFLSKCNIMDYSLLVGVDNDKREMTVGIVDFIGAYTWYKKMESRGKSTLSPRREITVVPPDQYKLRFCREVCDYFIPVPGKFDLVAPSNTLPSFLI
ncbi:unnamed protein product [Mucor hiemalis]